MYYLMYYSHSIFKVKTLDSRLRGNDVCGSAMVVMARE
ncbi:hypothetical protein GP5015_1441 [gamma proteobacterium HTCC5015]|nr:hypothetical protein GP5015_1441 [gamma proteobacterium HTCC5015]